jgi:phenylacetic acid degradation operon negative regulatory protein
MTPGTARLAAIDDVVAAFRAQPRIRAGSLIITVYGDAIAPRGGTVWLGSLIGLLSPFGLNQRLIRTSVFRLVRDGWLEAEQIGRRSYYSLTESGRRQFENAYRRIYTGPVASWDGRWCFVLAGGLDGPRRESLRRELRWQGFGTIATTVFAHPAPDRAVLRAVLSDLGASDDVLVMQAGTGAMPNAPAERRLVQASWDLRELSQQYHEFLERFRPVYAAVKSARRIDPEQGLLARTLLLHEYRRIMLRDPKLPAELLPAHWPGNAAYALCASIYQRVHAVTESFLSRTLETADGPLPRTAEYFYQRFGGLQRPKRMNGT